MRLRIVLEPREAARAVEPDAAEEPDLADGRADVLRQAGCPRRARAPRHRRTRRARTRRTRSHRRTRSRRSPTRSCARTRSASAPRPPASYQSLPRGAALRRRDAGRSRRPAPLCRAARSSRGRSRCRARRSRDCDTFLGVAFDARPPAPPSRTVGSANTTSRTSSGLTDASRIDRHAEPQDPARGREHRHVHVVEREHLIAQHAATGRGTRAVRGARSSPPTPAAARRALRGRSSTRSRKRRCVRSPTTRRNHVAVGRDAEPGRGDREHRPVAVLDTPCASSFEPECQQRVRATPRTATIANANTSSRGLGAVAELHQPPHRLTGHRAVPGQVVVPSGFDTFQVRTSYDSSLAARFAEPGRLQVEHRAGSDRPAAMSSAWEPSSTTRPPSTRRCDRRGARSRSGARSGSSCSRASRRGCGRRSRPRRARRAARSARRAGRRPRPAAPRTAHGRARRAATARRTSRCRRRIHAPGSVSRSARSLAPACCERGADRRRRGRRAARRSSRNGQLVADEVLEHRGDAGHATTRGRTRGGRYRRPRSRRVAGRTAGTAAWPTSSCPRRSARRSRARCPRGIVRSRPSSTGRSSASYANVRSRTRISRAGIRRRQRVPGWAARRSVPSPRPRRIVAATGCAAPSSAQFRPPNAIELVPTAAVANTTSAESVMLPDDAAFGERPEHEAVGREHEHERPDDRLLAQPRRPPLQLEQPAPPGREPIDRPIRQPEQPDLLRRGRVDREAVRVVGVPLRARAPRRCCGRARPSSRAAASASPPTHRRARAAPTTRYAREEDRLRDPAGHVDEADRDEVHRDRERRPRDAEVEVARHREIVGERGPLEVRHARRPDAGAHEPIVQPRRGAAPEVRAHRLVDRREHLQQHEHDTHERERHAERVALPAPRRSRHPSRSRTAAGSAPRNSRTTHHTVASGRSAFGSTAKNCHSLRARRPRRSRHPSWAGPGRTSSGGPRGPRRRTRGIRAGGSARRSSRRRLVACARCASRSSTKTHGMCVSRVRSAIASPSSRNTSSEPVPTWNSIHGASSPSSGVTVDRTRTRSASQRAAGDGLAVVQREVEPRLLLRCPRCGQRRLHHFTYQSGTTRTNEKLPVTFGLPPGSTRACTCTLVPAVGRREAHFDFDIVDRAAATATSRPAPRP